MEEIIISNDEVFEPTLEEFFDLHTLIDLLESKNFDAGFAKVRAPQQWLDQWDDVTLLPPNLPISPVAQNFKQHGDGYLIEKHHLKRPTMTLSEYVQRVSETVWPYSDVDECEHHYWSTLRQNAPTVLYGADINYSLARGEEVDGIHRPYLYRGSAGSTFGFHTEDYDLHSINIHLHGAPKVWYFVPREDGYRFDQIVSSLFP
ncbi:lysine-specific demethylase 4E-like [Diachasma alloeum]|uniref:lysine-specific demethylase 4E-like n=1 Tax=Diachasma alloeum TaxID=454923 RepID=UPI0007381C22|nr:lysine-specific demethylase 4E-like [Diachasma alloeum]